MKRHLIAGLVMLLPTVAWAQEAPARPYTSVQTCGPYTIEVPYTSDMWSRMNETQRWLGCREAGLKPWDLTGPLVATKRTRSLPLAWTGVVLAIGGGAMLLPQGKNYRFLDETYCVTDYSVDYGGCGPSWSLAKVGLIALGAGVTLAWIGLQEVDIKPLVGPDTKGATATVKWGGKGKR